ncbi:uncharacterized protein [Mytilus edulis]|uniref:uncharacterized protein n=1 Tax=Mytilus edulis TaxID=6550 RepID=UPI0039EED45D
MKAKQVKSRAMSEMHAQSVSTSGYGSYGSYGTTEYSGYPIHTSVVTRHSSHHSYHGVSYYKRYHGFKISHRRFFYHGLGYKLRCGKSRFYRLWRRCYGKYHSRSRCFGVFRTRHLFSLYKGHGKKYHGFKLRHNRFFYGGHGYKLRCARRVFYRSWRSCYRRYHSRSACFGYLRKRHLFGIYHRGSSYGGVYGGYGHGRNSYSYYISHHGFSIRHNRFLYHGISYRLKCSSNRFYRLWSNCYDHYHSVGTCFGRLRRQHLFYRYVGGSSYGGIVGGYGHGKYSYSYYRSHHGFQIRHNRFLYHGISYQLKCSSSQFYRLWSECYDEYHSIGDCFELLRRQHLFYKYVAGIFLKQIKTVSNIFVKYNKKHELNVDYLHGKHEHTINKLHDYHGIYGVGHLVSYLDYYKKYHGFKISHNRFSYGGKAYTLKCGLQRFYNLWSNCWSSYHRRSLCFGRLRKSHLFELYSGDYDNDYAPGAVVVKNTVYGGGYHLGDSHVVTYMDYYKKYHGFKISHSRFTYGGKGKAVSCIYSEQ